MDLLCEIQTKWRTSSVRTTVCLTRACHLFNRFDTTPGYDRQTARCSQALCGFYSTIHLAVVTDRSTVPSEDVWLSGVFGGKSVSLECITGQSERSRADFRHFQASFEDLLLHVILDYRMSSALEIFW